MLQEQREPLEWNLTEMWQTHRAYVKRLLIRMTRDFDLADDLVQETYLRACAGIVNFRGGDSRAWLATIARNVFLMHLRRASTRYEVMLDDNAVVQAGVAGDPACELEMLELRQAVEALPTSYKIALVMKQFGGFTYEEIARMTRCPVGTAKWRVRTALIMLRESLERTSMPTAPAWPRGYQR